MVKGLEFFLPQLRWVSDFFLISFGKVLGSTFGGLTKSISSLSSGSSGQIASLSSSSSGHSSGGSSGGSGSSNSDGSLEFF